MNIHEAHAILKDSFSKAQADALKRIFIEYTTSKSIINKKAEKSSKQQGNEMGRQIILRDDPNKISVWSTIVDSFIFHGSLEAYIRLRRAELADGAEETIRRVVQRLKDGENVYGQFQMTYEEASRLAYKIHFAHREYKDEHTNSK